MECKAGGRIHPKLNTCLRLIGNKYLEGNVKRTLQRELNESEHAAMKANVVEALISRKVIHNVLKMCSVMAHDVSSVACFPSVWTICACLLILPTAVF